ncbi:MAG: cbb3-type cytochrome c oxidase subunit 3 [Alphaproteobacteria bacterium]|nr:cbb3-type cytochrome c oxidase subunit 3 [Alphaproteobacteria bacterium]
MQADYTLLRELADSWGLLLMFLFFVGAIVWALRPSAKAIQDDASQIPFRED